MPIATKTDLANLALDLLGEPYLSDYEADVGTAADAVRLHIDQCIETVLEGHVWSFATRCATLVAKAADALVLSGDATTDGDGGPFTIEWEDLVDSGTLVNGKPKFKVDGGSDSIKVCYYTGTRWMLYWSGAAPMLNTTFYAAPGDEPSPDLASWTDTSDNSSYSTGYPIFTADYGSAYAPAWGSVFSLPADCLRVLKLDGTDIDIPQDRWEIQARFLFLRDALASAPVIHYIAKNPPVSDWPTTYTDAVSFLLAARLAPKIAQDRGLAADLTQKHEIALGKARSKDARETRSKENSGPRTLAARSSLVRARYLRGGPQPPY